jgi:DNA-directed RNA polymerase sigma subunit (sigma70/sigma32)
VGVTSEEVQRVLDSIDALGEITDPASRARQLGVLLDKWPGEHSRVREMRAEAIRAMKRSGMTYQEIGAELGFSSNRARQIAENITASGKRAKGAEAPEEPPPQDRE